jgi:hypothetical protein
MLVRLARLATAALLVTACSQTPAAGPSDDPGDTGGSGGSSKSGGAGGKSAGGAGGRSSGSGGTAAAGGEPGGTGGAGEGDGGSSGQGDGGQGSGGKAGEDEPDAAPGADDAAMGGSGSGEGGGAGGSTLPPGDSPITKGFTMTPYTYEIQSPYKVPQAERYTFDMATNTHICWVKSDDSSFQAGNGTDPRTELRWKEEWTSGQHMLEADVWIKGTTDRTNIVQVFSTTPPTTFMLTAWKDKTLRYYFGNGDGPVIMNDAFEKWFNLKVLHDVGTHTVTVFINDVKSMSFHDKGSHWHFKNGNYGCRSERCETHWRNLRYWVKN